jgi:hypothetical protein
LKTIFCEIRFPRSAPSKAFRRLEFKKITPDAPQTSKRHHGEMLAQLYFGAEIHIRSGPFPLNPNKEATKLTEANSIS